MNDILTVLYNNNPELEYDRGKPLPDHQALYLDKMDEKMDKGISIGEEQITNPDTSQRARFVAANLAHALQTNHETMMASLCTWLAVRVPELKQLRINARDDGMEIDFDYENYHAREVLVAPPTRLN